MCGEDILHLLPVRIRCMVEKLRLDYGRLWEIRLRVNSPFIRRYMLIPADQEPVI